MSGARQTEEDERETAKKVVAKIFELVTVTAERDSLAAFKVYVHKRLDEGGVPVDPPSVHQIAGCRIGGRLDTLFAQRDDLLAACEDLHHHLSATCRGVAVIDEALDAAAAVIAKARGGVT